MKETRMDVLTAINSRASAKTLSEPGPTPAQLETILGAAVRAPDHGRLSPWRFVVLSGARREILANAMIELTRRQHPGAAADELNKAGQKAMRAPTIVVVAAHTTDPAKIPAIERIVAVGAAVQNMFLAAHALGLGAMWKTGDAAYDDKVKTALGLEAGDHIVAFLYLGTTVTAGVPRDSTLEGLVVAPKA
jgi:nitroreductase